MLRKTIVLLLLLNLVCWAWAQGWLAWMGLPATPAGEPERLVNQIRPETLHVQPLPSSAVITDRASADRDK